VVLVLEVVVLVVGLESLQVVSLLGILPLVLNTRMGGVVALRWRGGTVHGLPIVVLVLLHLERDGSLVVVTMVVFVDVTPKNSIIAFNKILLSNKCLFKDF
jgi:hypothetical protein